MKEEMSSIHMDNLKKLLKDYLKKKDVPIRRTGKDGKVFGGVFIRKTKLRGVYVTYNLKENIEKVQQVIISFFEELGTNSYARIEKRTGNLIVTLSLYGSRKVINKKPYK